MLLYNANLSPNALRVRAVANELGIELEFKDVDLRKGENRSASFLALNPNAKVPVLVDGDFVLWESRAIDAYLASLKPQMGLYPEDPRKRAIADQWSYWQAIHLGPAMQRVVFERLLKPKFGMGEPDEKSLEGSLKEVAQFLPVLDANLSDKEWVAGQLSIADFAVASTFVFRKPAGISLESAAHVSSWIERLESRASWQAAVGPALEALKTWSA
jgi:glutathione S-transferase